MGLKYLFFSISVLATFILPEMGVWDVEIYVSTLTRKPRAAGYASCGGRCDDWVSTDQIRGVNMSSMRRQQIQEGESTIFVRK